MDGTDVINQALASIIDTELVAKQLEQAFKDEILANASSEQVSDEEVMADVYQRVLLSPAVESLLTQEYELSVQMQDLVDEQEREWQYLTQRQTEELCYAVDQLTEVEVNEISVRHCEERQIFESGWESRLVNVQETQKLHFREWLLGMAEIVETGGQLPIRPEDDFEQVASDPENLDIPSVFRLEESFTIQLGAQMKQSHNLRLISADVLDLCRLPLTSRNDPQRLQMALSLYSSNQSGLVLLVDDRLSAYTGMEKEFLRICRRGAELHFPRADLQLENARNTFSANAFKWRQQISNRRINELESNGGQPKTKTPRLGDMYVSRHSNLAQVHVVFHLVSDDSVRSNEINSRHPVLLGLRHILRTAVVSDITTLTIPLLLVHELSEEMTVPWCLRRAELVFKCVKGFMMETASYGAGVDSRGSGSSPTLQFLLPRDAADEVFHALAAMLPGVFRVSNPLVLRSDAVR
ncbi:hypothetical protein DAPPUDRAFT_311543 [Daphnia pulex]|uniref:Uncharacterized protein n=1 Tax=Daphnia pulex TaxID=6669 RepID=E9FX75_DAPPU|nr:hypothetical protein DAPPUDRAFT_311543 [Daphnia pulex]|eukprot:EFX88030.1 hypothetical protein DAPPUDRAFT_311543 [Daphnia pulex]